MTVTSIRNAWVEVQKIFPTDLSMRPAAASGQAMMGCIMDCITAVDILANMEEDVDYWMISGIIEWRMGAKFREVFRSITVDNGCEFQDCQGMERSKRARKPRTKIYYCHPYSAYERGSNENLNRIIRRWLPKGTNFDTIAAEEVAVVEEWLANYPRRILGWKTPQMLYDEYMTVDA